MLYTELCFQLCGQTRFQINKEYYDLFLNLDLASMEDIDTNSLLLAVGLLALVLLPQVLFSTPPATRDLSTTAKKKDS